MRKLVVPAAVAALLATSALSFAAATLHETGVVKSFNHKAMSLTLADGSSYMLPRTFKDPGLQSGQKVSIAYEKAAKNRIAQDVTILK